METNQSSNESTENTGSVESSESNHGQMFTDSSESATTTAETTTTQPAIATAPVTTADQKPVEYNPNFKFHSSGQEYEIDEEYRGYIKSADDEKRIKRVFEQIKGVEKLKADREQYKATYTDTKVKLDSYENGFKKFNEYIGKGDYKKAFDLFQIPAQVLYKAALQQAEFDELPQRQKEVYSQLQQQEQHAATLWQQNQQVLQQINQYKAQALSSELTNVLNRQDVKSVAEKYDQAYGPGSFKQQIIKRGQQMENPETGEGPTATQVVEEFIQMFKPFVSQPAPQAQQEVPVIPATGPASTRAPQGQAITSLADLERVANEKLSSLRR